LWLIFIDKNMKIIITEWIFNDLVNKILGKSDQQKSSTGKQKYDGSTLSVSANIWPFLREWEGDPKNRKNGVKEPKYKAYKDAVGVWTIGYGHTLNVKPTDRLKSKKEADDLLVQDVRENANYVTFNSGIGNLRKSQLIQALKKGDDKKAAELLKTYNTVGLSGVSKRREGELKLFQS